MTKRWPPNEFRSGVEARWRPGIDCGQAEERHQAFRSAEEKRELDELAQHLAALRVGGQVPGWRVLELARAYGMTVPPQTAGVLKRATWISETGAQFPSKPSKSQAIWDVYRFARDHAR